MKKFKLIYWINVLRLYMNFKFYVDKHKNL